LALSCAPPRGMAQSGTTHIDSLERVLKNKLADSDRFDVLEKLFDHYKAIDYQKALGYANQSYSTGLAMGDSNKIVLGGRHQAYVLMDLGKNKEAVEILEKSLAIAERNVIRYPELNKSIRAILNNIGLAYTYIGKYDKALEYHFKSLAKREGEKDKKAISSTLNNIGLVFYEINDFKKANEYFLKVMDLKNENRDYTNLDLTLINIGSCYIQMKDYKRAINYFNEGFKICGENCAYNIESPGLVGLGIAYRKSTW
jgi:tetratricopeptide (TPR) repeat protein